MPLGNQSNGFFFFTTRCAADNHAKFQQEKKSLTTVSQTNLYLITAEINIDDVRYPVWQLDYEAMRDYFFDLLLNRAIVAPIGFLDVKIMAVNKTLQIQDGNKFMKLREFTPEHSGLIEKIVAFLYLKDKNFQTEYNNLLHNVLIGDKSNDDTTAFAIKTIKCPHLLSCEKIENTIQPIQSSQIAKWYDRYNRR